MELDRRAQWKKQMLLIMGTSDVSTYATHWEGVSPMTGLPNGVRAVDCRTPAELIDSAGVHPIYHIRLVIVQPNKCDGYEIRFDRNSWFTAWRCVREQAFDSNHPMTVALAEWCQRKIKATAKYHGWV